MDKDIIYIDPSDDITDILNKIKQSEKAAVSLVPPKKSGVMHSSVNLRLIAKIARSGQKDIAIITSDEALIRLAAMAKIPVTKNLTGKATVPDLEEDIELPKLSKVIEEDVEQSEEDDTETISAPAEAAEKEEVAIPRALRPKKSKSDAAKSNPQNSESNSTFDKYRKFIIVGVASALAIIVFLVWALLFAPSATVIARVRTTPHNFSEQIQFTTTKAAAKPAKGIFYAKEQAKTVSDEIEFAATGEKDKGKKASGSLKLLRRGPSASITKDNNRVNISPLTVPAGTKFVYNGLGYIATASATFKGASLGVAEIIQYDCNKSACPGYSDEVSINVAAENPGEKYNSPSAQNWSSPSNAYSVTGANIGGGSSEIVKIVTQKDIQDAQGKIELDKRDDIKKQLFKELKADIFPIESSFDEAERKVSSTPTLGQEVGDANPKLKVEVKYHVLGVSRKELSTFIEKKTLKTVGKGKKVFATGLSQKTTKTKNGKNNTKEDAYLDDFKKDKDNYTAKLKTITQTGPKIEDKDILERVVGKKTGEAKAAVESIDGVVSAEIQTSFFWVNSVPKESQRVKVHIEITEGWCVSSL